MQGKFYQETFVLPISNCHLERVRGIKRTSVLPAIPYEHYLLPQRNDERLLLAVSNI